MIQWESNWYSSSYWTNFNIFLSACLWNCFLCWDHVSGDVPPDLAQSCYLLFCYLLKDTNANFYFRALLALIQVLNNSTLLLVISDCSVFGSGDFMFKTFQVGPFCHRSEDCTLAEFRSPLCFNQIWSVVMTEVSSFLLASRRKSF